MSERFFYDDVVSPDSGNPNLWVLQRQRTVGRGIDPLGTTNRLLSNSSRRTSRIGTLGQSVNPIGSGLVNLLSDANYETITSGVLNIDNLISGSINNSWNGRNNGERRDKLEKAQSAINEKVNDRRAKTLYKGADAWGILDNLPVIGFLKDLWDSIGDSVTGIIAGGDPTISHYVSALDWLSLYEGSTNDIQLPTFSTVLVHGAPINKSTTNQLIDILKAVGGADPDEARLLGGLQEAPNQYKAEFQSYFKGLTAGAAGNFNFSQQPSNNGSFRIVIGNDSNRYVFSNLLPTRFSFNCSKSLRKTSSLLTRDPLYINVSLDFKFAFWTARQNMINLLKTGKTHIL